MDHAVDAETRLEAFLAQFSALREDILQTGSRHKGIIEEHRVLRSQLRDERVVVRGHLTVLKQLRTTLQNEVRSPHPSNHVQEPSRQGAALPPALYRSHSSRCWTEQEGDILVVCVEGEIDLLNAADLLKNLQELAGASPMGVVVDLSRVTYFDLYGVRVLETFRKNHRNGQSLAIVATSPVGGMLKVAGLDQAIPVYTSRHEAITFQ